MKKLNTENYTQAQSGIYLPDKKFIITNIFLSDNDTAEPVKIRLNDLHMER